MTLYSFQPYDPMVSVCSLSCLIQSTKSADTHHTVKYIWFQWAQHIFLLIHLLLLPSAKGKTQIIIVLTHPIFLLKGQLLRDDLETERFKPVRCEHCGPNSDIKWRLRRTKHILAISGSVSVSGSLFRRLLILYGETELCVFHSGRKTTEN